MVDEPSADDSSSESVAAAATDPATETDGPAGASSPRRRLRAASVAVVGVGLAAAAWLGWTQIKPTIEARKYMEVSDRVPDAPRLDAGAGERLLRIDASRSSLTYEIEERFVGRSATTTRGTTRGVAGDLALAEADLSKSRLGQMVVDIEQFRSDNNLRDARIRMDFLESAAHPLATFDTTSIEGLAGRLEDGMSATFSLRGDLIVKGISAPTTWEVDATYDDGVLTATATTTAKLSRFDAGPISIAGLLSTADDIDLILELTAVDPAEVDVPSTIESEVAAASTDGAPSFAREVRPILEHNCALCHGPGQMASDSIRLATSGDAAAISDGLKTVTQTGYMPPWPASDEGVELAHVARLSADEIDTIARWADAGGPLDEPKTTKIEMTEENASLLPRKDTTIRIPEYLGTIENRNDYRCFVLDPELTEPTFMTGYTFEAPNIRQVHHAQVFQISEEQKAFAAAEREGSDGRSGWECYAGPGLRGQRPSKRDSIGENDVGFTGQSDLVGGWVPGQVPVVFRENSGILLQPGDALVLQIHYYFATDPIPDETGLSLQLDPVDSGIQRMRIVNPLGPVEIPCHPDDEGAPLCDRDAALEENVRLYGPSGASNERGLLMLCGKSVDELVAGFDGNVARSDCLHRVPEDGVLTSVTGHMHTIGKELRMILEPDTPDETLLLDIPEWNFDWQMNYALAEPMRVEAGQLVRLECAWDRRKAPEREPKYIVFAEGTEDEMCFATYTLIPDDQ